MAGETRGVDPRGYGHGPVHVRMVRGNHPLANVVAKATLVFVDKSFNVYTCIHPAWTGGERETSGRVSAFVPARDRVSNTSKSSPRDPSISCSGASSKSLLTRPTRRPRDNRRESRRRV